MGPPARVAIWLLMGLTGPFSLLGVSAVVAAIPPADLVSMELARIDSLLNEARPEPAAARATRLLRQYPEDPLYTWQIEQRLGLALFKLGRAEAAVPHLEQAIRLAPQVSASHLNLAAVLMALDRRGRALAEYQEAVDLDPTGWRGRLDYGQALHTFGLHADAQREMQEADQLCNGCLEVARALAGLHLDTKDYARAVALLMRLYESSPTEEVRHNLALASLHAGAPERTSELLAPSWPHDLSAADRILLLEADRALGDTERARVVGSDLQDGQAMEGDALLWGLVAYLCLQGHHDVEGLAAIDRAIDLDPDNAAYRNNRVVLLTRLEQHDEAQREWERVRALAPELVDDPD